ncbi:MAG: aminotransferase class I/II-fold pyridoxal phosphate-dependent enzyme [Chloroflexi bacterium]|nr:MAG: aminotransferase class I/II-fold pyridoxal phosphate-dependent enzyme [Chloroflexota bacterium]
MKVAYQGAPGAYSESAAATMFPDEERVAERTFADVFAALSSNAVRAAVVPVENTLAGSVVDVYDLLRTHDDLTVLGEVAIPIRHCLLVVPGTRIDEVRVARSHAHAIAQVEDYLRANGIEAQVAYDTAGAASEVALAGDRSVAAVAARRAATTAALCDRGHPDDEDRVAAEPQRAVAVRLLSRLRGPPRGEPRARGARAHGDVLRVDPCARHVPLDEHDRRRDHDVSVALRRAAGSIDALGRAPNDVYGSFIDETIGIVARQTRDTVSFAVGSPAPEALEMVGADDLARAVVARDGAKALGYTMTEGEPELREFVASAARGRGIPAAAAETLISAGALQAIDLVCRVFLRKGDVVVAESPAFANALSAFRNHGAQVLEIPIRPAALPRGGSLAPRFARGEGERRVDRLVLEDVPPGPSCGLGHRRA